MSDFDFIYKDGEEELLIESTKLSSINEKEVEARTREISDSLVAELLELRKGMKLTQQDIADAIGIPRANVSRMERKLYTPTLGLLMKYADSLGKSIELKLVDKEKEAV